MAFSRSALPLIASRPPAFYDRLQRTRGRSLAREQRKLAAILAADVVGHSRLMGRTKAGRWRACEIVARNNWN